MDDLYHESKPIDILRRVKTRIENGGEITGIWGSEFTMWDRGSGPAWEFVRRTGNHSGAYIKSEAMRVINEVIALAEKST